MKAEGYERRTRCEVWPSGGRGDGDIRARIIVCVHACELKASFRTQFSVAADIRARIVDRADSVVVEGASLELVVSCPRVLEHVPQIEGA
jgi:hypothetical protein